MYPQGIGQLTAPQQMPQAAPPPMMQPPPQQAAPQPMPAGPQQPPAPQVPKHLAGIGLNLVQTQEKLKDLSDQQLTQYLQKGEGGPPALVLAELNRRKRTRDGATQQTETTVADDILAASGIGALAPQRAGLAEGGPAAQRVQAPSFFDVLRQPGLAEQEALQRADPFRVTAPTFATVVRDAISSAMETRAYEFERKRAIAINNPETFPDFVTWVVNAVTQTVNSTPEYSRQLAELGGSITDLQSEVAAAAMQMAQHGPTPPPTREAGRTAQPIAASGVSTFGGPPRPEDIGVLPPPDEYTPPAPDEYTPPSIGRLVSDAVSDAAQDWRYRRANQPPPADLSAEDLRRLQGAERFSYGDAPGLGVLSTPSDDRAVPQRSSMSDNFSSAMEAIKRGPMLEYGRQSLEYGRQGIGSALDWADPLGRPPPQSGESMGQFVFGSETRGSPASLPPAPKPVTRDRTVDFYTDELEGVAENLYDRPPALPIADVTPEARRIGITGARTRGGPPTAEDLQVLIPPSLATQEPASAGDADPLQARINNVRQQLSSMSRLNPQHRALTLTLRDLESQQSRGPVEARNEAQMQELRDSVAGLTPVDEFAQRPSFLSALKDQAVQTYQDERRSLSDAIESVIPTRTHQREGSGRTSRLVRVADSGPNPVANLMEYMFPLNTGLEPPVTRTGSGQMGRRRRPSESDITSLDSNAPRPPPPVGGNPDVVVEPTESDPTPAPPPPAPPPPAPPRDAGIASLMPSPVAPPRMASPALPPPPTRPSSEPTSVAETMREAMAATPGVEAQEAERFAQEFERGRRSGINMPLLVTGLSLMASKTPNFLGALGESGLAGLSAHMREREKDADNQFKAFELRARGRELDRSEEHRAFGRAHQTATLEHNISNDAWTRDYNVWNTQMRSAESAADRANRIALAQYAQEAQNFRTQMGLLARGAGGGGNLNPSMVNAMKSMVEERLEANRIEMADALRYFNGDDIARNDVLSRAQTASARHRLEQNLTEIAPLFQQYQLLQRRLRQQMLTMGGGYGGDYGGDYGGGGGYGGVDDINAAYIGSSPGGF